MHRHPSRMIGCGPSIPVGNCNCHPSAISNETRVKHLEAMKSKLQDMIKQLDDRITEYQKVEEED
ncbi:MAG: hypothetical protein R6V83_13690 [Candidatus Thorarchaeota archaeon]